MLVAKKSCIIVLENEWLAAHILEKYKNQTNDLIFVVWTEYVRKKTSHLFENHISGLREGKRSIHYIRNYAKRKPEMLTYPVILISTHVRSLHGGCFDYTINPDTLNRGASISQFCDGPNLGQFWWVDDLMELLCKYCEDWYKQC